MQTLLQERDQATERLAAEADYAFSQLLASISEQYEGFRDGKLLPSSASANLPTVCHSRCPARHFGLLALLGSRWPSAGLHQTSKGGQD